MEVFATNDIIFYGGTVSLSGTVVSRLPLHFSCTRVVAVSSKCRRARVGLSGPFLVEVSTYTLVFARPRLHCRLYSDLIQIHSIMGNKFSNCPFARLSVIALWLGAMSADRHDCRLLNSSYFSGLVGAVAYPLCWL